MYNRIVLLYQLLRRGNRRAIELTLCRSSGRPAANMVFPRLSTMEVATQGQKISAKTSKPTSSAAVITGRRSSTWTRTRFRIFARGPLSSRQDLSSDRDRFWWGVTGTAGELGPVFVITIVYADQRWGFCQCAIRRWLAYLLAESAEFLLDHLSSFW